MEVALLSQVVRMLFFTFVVISGLLLVGTVIRAKVKLMQKLFLPASVIGGFVGLLLGPIVLKDYAILPIPQDWLSLASLLPGLLIVPVVAAVPLGLAMNEKNIDGTKKNKGATNNVIIMLLILVAINSIQNVFSLSLAGVFEKFFNYDFYPTFGTELSAGFAGGHGTAGVVGSLLQSLGQPYWEVAQGVTTTTATFGLIGGLLVGIVLINFAARKGYTNFLTTGADLPEEMKTGIQKDLKKQGHAGLESTNSSSIDSLALHLALILGVSGLSFTLTFLFKKYNVLVLNMIPEWAYAIILMYIVWGLMVKMKLDWVVDNKTKGKITSTLADYAIVAAIMSLPIKAVLTYLVPLLVTMAGALALTVAAAYFLCKWLFGDYWFERSMPILGTNTGVFLTGLLLLKMVDPDLKSPVLRDYSLSYSFNSVIGFILIPLLFGLLINQGLLAGIGLYTGTLIVSAIGLLIYGRRERKRA